MSGSALAVFCALMFGSSETVMRRAVIKIPDATLGVLINVPVGMLIFLTILILTHQTHSLVFYSPVDYLYFSGAGILQFAVYRSFMHVCVKRVGANITSALRRITTLVAVILGISLLGEPITLVLTLGVLFILFGVTLAGLNPQHLDKRFFSNVPLKALLFGILGGIAGGSSMILVRVGLSGEITPLSGLFISHLSATICLYLPLLIPSRRKSFTRMPVRAVGLFIITGLMVAVGNLFRYAALDLAPASVVAPLISISPVFLLVFSFLFNRSLEVFSRPVVIGILSVIMGSILLVI